MAFFFRFYLGIPQPLMSDFKATLYIADSSSRTVYSTTLLDANDATGTNSTYPIRSNDFEIALNEINSADKKFKFGVHVETSTFTTTELIVMNSIALTGTLTAPTPGELVCKR
jgi:hypothetical protein